MRRSFILICVALLLSVFANAQSYQIIVNITGNGNVTYNDAAVQNADVITVDENATPAFTIAPETGNRLVSVMLDGENVAESLVEGVYTFAAVTADHILDVTFEEDNDTPEPTMFGITFVGLEEGNTVTVPENARVDSVASGENYVFGITLATCQEAIASVTVGGTELAASEGQYTIENVVSDTTVTVVFTKYQYTVTAEAGDHGAVAEGFASKEIECGADYTITFVPDENYKLGTVTVDGELATEGIDGNTFTLTNVRAAHSISATFEEIPVIPEPTMFGITFVGLVEGNTITVPENARVDSVASGENYVFGITLTSCQEAIASVTVGGTVLTASEGQYTIENIVSDTTVTVAFTKYQYTVTAEAGEHGAVAEGFASREIDCGTDYTIEFVPEPNYRLEKIILDEVETTEGIEGNNFTLTNVVAAHAVSATFEEIPVTPEPTMFGITFVGLEEGDTIIVPENARVDSVAPGENYVFGITLTSCQEAIASVTVGGTVLTADEGQYTIENVVSDTTVTVEFTKYFYTVTAEAGEHGAVAEGFASNDVECGTDYAITFVPDEGYILDSVVVDGVHVTTGISRNTFTLTNVDSLHVVKGFFATDTNIGSKYRITFAGLGANDSIVIPVTEDSTFVHTAAIKDSVLYGDDFVFAINAERCHYVSSVTVNGTAIEADTEGFYTIEGIYCDTTVTVGFTTYRYTVTASAGEHGRLVSDAEAEVECGSSLTFSFVPDAGYKLGSVLLDGESTTLGVNGNTYTLTVYDDHTVVGVFTEFRGPYIEYEGLVAEYEVGDTIDFSLRMHANCMFENICGVGYAVIKGTDTVADVTRFGVLSYKVNVTDDSFVGYQIENGAGMMTYTTEYDTITYNVGAFTLGLFDEAAGRNRTIDYNMIFTTAGQYRIANTLYTCSNGGELIGSNFVASECDDLTHNDRVAEVCANPTPVYSIYSDINITGETIHTITTTVLGGHGSVDPEGTIIVPAGSTQRIQFIPDEYYALDTVKSNGFLIYPSLQTQYVVDSVFVIDSVTENYNITVSFKDVRPYYTVHVEVATAGGTVTPKDTTVVIGSDVTLTITPNEGYHISQLSIDGNIIANYASNEIIFRDINEDHEVSISFFPNSVEDEMFSNLSIYPNPNNGQFTVSSDDFDGNVTFQIYSISGAIMDEMSINGEKSVSFSKSLPAGTYFLRIIAGDKVATRKIVVE